MNFKIYVRRGYYLCQNQRDDILLDVRMLLLAAFQTDADSSIDFVLALGI